MDRPRFRGVTVCEVVGTSPVQLNAWRARGQLQIDHPAQGHPIRYTMADLMRAVLLVELGRVGVTPGSGLAKDAQRAMCKETVLSLGDSEGASLVVNVPALWARTEVRLSQVVL